MYLLAAQQFVNRIQEWQQRQFPALRLAAIPPTRSHLCATEWKSEGKTFELARESHNHRQSEDRLVPTYANAG
jgi:hypothetical protein